MRNFRILQTLKSKKTLLSHSIESKLLCLPNKRSNNQMKDFRILWTGNSYNKLCFPQSIESKLSLTVGSWEERNCNLWLVLHLNDEHTLYLSFLVRHHTFWPAKKYAKKVRKFATKIASRQNSVNFWLAYLVFWLAYLVFWLSYLIF